MEPLLTQLSETVSHAQSLEALTRPLLQMLQQISQLESTYLTRVDLPQAMQHVLYSCNQGGLHIAEGLEVAWSDTLCKRALDDEQPFTDNVQERWGDCTAAAALGLRTYISTPVRLPQGQFYGTLCAASGSKRSLPDNIQGVLQLFATLIGQHVEREILLQELRQRNQELSTFALTDALTGLPNRRAMLEELPRAWARSQRQKRTVLLAFMDLDHFKMINDEHGHAVGDQLLCTVARQLHSALRESDFAARIGGDEFVMIGEGPETNLALNEVQKELQERLHAASQCDVALPNGLLRYPGASVGVIAADPSQSTVEQALALADQAMYSIKAIRKALYPQPQ